MPQLRHLFITWLTAHACTPHRIHSCSHAHPAAVALSLSRIMQEQLKISESCGVCIQKHVPAVTNSTVKQQHGGKELTQAQRQKSTEEREWLLNYSEIHEIPRFHAPQTNFPAAACGERSGQPHQTVTLFKNRQPMPRQNDLQQRHMAGVCPLEVSRGLKLLHADFRLWASP